MPPESALHTELAALRRKRDGIGPVNLRAEEDARALRADTVCGPGGVTR